MSNFDIQSAQTAVQWGTFAMGAGFGFCVACLSRGLTMLMGWEK